MCWPRRKRRQRGPSFALPRMILRRRENRAAFMSAPVDRKPSIKQRRLAPGERAWRGLATPYRAAGLLVVEQRILLVRHEVGGDIYWIRPAAASSRNATNRRRIPSGASFRGDRPAGGRRPAGLRARIRRTRRRALPMELFYRIDAWRGEPTLANLKGLGGDEFDIREVGWIARDELPGLPSSIRPNWPTTSGRAWTRRRHRSATSACSARRSPHRIAGGVLEDRLQLRGHGELQVQPLGRDRLLEPALVDPVSRPSDTARPGSR